MSIYKSTNLLSAIFKGTDEVLKIYVGINLAYEKDTGNLLDNGTNYSNWQLDPGSSITANGIKLVQDAANEFAKCNTPLVQPNTNYELVYKVNTRQAVYGFRGLSNLTGTSEVLDYSIGTHTYPFTTQSTITDNSLNFSLVSTADGDFLEIEPISITEVVVPVGTYASAYGLIPNDAGEADNNADKLMNCINANGNIIIDNDDYNIGNTSVSLTATDIRIEGYNGGAMIFNASSYTRVLFEPNAITDALIKNVTIKNLSTSINQLLFYESTKLSTQINSIEFSGCTFEGRIAPYRLVGADLNPATNTYGITSFKFNDNICNDMEISAIYLKNMPFTTVEFKRNTINNFRGTFLDMSIDNTFTYHATLKGYRTDTYIDNNTVINDTSWFDTYTSGYHALVVIESENIDYSYNHVEGLKTTNSVALYDAYMSCEDVHSHHNTWENNVSQGPNSIHTLIKSKTGRANPTRLYEYNTYTLESTYAASIGWNVSDMTVGFINADSDVIDTFEISNCTFNIHEMYFRNHSDTIKDYIFNDNDMVIDTASGNMHFAQIQGGYDNSVVFNNNDITITNRGTHWDGTGTTQLRCIATSDPSTSGNTMTSLTFNNNTINAPLSYLVYYPRSDVFNHSGNNITVQSAYWVQDVYPVSEGISVTVV